MSAELGALVGPAVGVLFGGVLGAGIGTMILYAGAVESGEAEDIFKEAAVEAPVAPAVKAHSVREEKFVLKRYMCRGFAAAFA